MSGIQGPRASSAPAPSVLGAQGAQGPQGERGLPGENIVLDRDSDRDGSPDWIEVMLGYDPAAADSTPIDDNADGVPDLLVGPQGPRGARGPRGVAGPAGSQGERGPQGAIGRAAPKVPRVSAVSRALRVLVVRPAPAWSSTSIPTETDSQTG